MRSLAELVIISSYPASPRRITVLVNFQAILMTFSLLKTVRKNFFPTSKISAQEIHHQFFLIWSNLTIMAHIMGFMEPIRKLENHYPVLKIY